MSRAAIQPMRAAGGDQLMSHEHQHTHLPRPAQLATRSDIAALQLEHLEVPFRNSWPQHIGGKCQSTHACALQGACHSAPAHSRSCSSTREAATAAETPDVATAALLFLGAGLGAGAAALVALLEVGAEVEVEVLDSIAGGSSTTGEVVFVVLFDEAVAFLAMVMSFMLGMSAIAVAFLLGWADARPAR